MAEGGRAVDGGGGLSSRSLPEVELKWSDFVWSMEKLRHKPYCRSMRERDWFSINPLEMVLIGAQSLASEEPARKDHGTMVLVMLSLNQEMALRPRYWIRLLQVLLVTIETADIPTTILQRCVSSLLAVWKALEAFPEFLPSVQARAITHLKMATILTTILHKHSPSLGPLLSEVQECVRDMDDMLSPSSSATCYVDGAHSPFQQLLQEFCDVGDDVLLTQVSLILKLKHKPSDYNWLAQSSLEEIMCVLKDCAHHGSHHTLPILLSIIQLLAIRGKGSEGEEDEKGPSEAEVSEVEKEEVGVQNEVGKEGSSGGSRSSGVISSLTMDLFDALKSSLLLWRSHACLHSSHDVADKLLGLVQIILAQRPLAASLPDAVEFLREAFPRLISYSTEGYLSDTPAEFLYLLLEFVSSLVEQGSSPMQALQTNLPNLFGPAFGLCHHDVSCKLLQYGYLAVCSQNKKLLLTEGLNFLFKLFRLFPPIDEVVAKRLVTRFWEEAVENSRCILEEILSSLPLEGEDQQHIEGNAGEDERELLQDEEKGNSESIAVAEAVSMAVVEAESMVAAETESAAVAEAASMVMAEAASMAVAEAKNMAVVETESMVVAEAESVAVVETESMVVAEAESVAVAETGSMVVAEAESMVVAEAESVAVAEAKSVVVAETESMVVAEAQSVVVAEIESKVVAEIESMAVAETEHPSSDMDSSECDEVSDEERKADRDIRHRILLGLLQLACAMIRNGEKTSFLLASCLPKLFVTTHPINKQQLVDQNLAKFFGESPPAVTRGIPWNVDIKMVIHYTVGNVGRGDDIRLLVSLARLLYTYAHMEKLAVAVLELSTLCLESTSVTPFQLCGIIIPKLVTNVDTMELSDEEKFSLTLYFLQVTKETIEAGQSVDDFISYGFSILFNLLSTSTSCTKLKAFISKMASHFITSSHTSLLYLIKTACSFMLSAFKDEADEIRELFMSLLFKGKRNEIRCLYRVCKSDLCEEKYAGLRRYLYGYPTGSISHRQLIALCELMATAMDITGSGKVATQEVIYNMEEEEEETVRERKKVEIAVLAKLTTPCLAKLEAALEGNRFKRDTWEDVASQLSKVALFRTLFLSKFYLYQDYTSEELLTAFQSKFPKEVLCSEDTMQLLALSTTRIEHMQIPRYNSLKRLLSSIFQHFLTCDMETAVEDSSSLPNIPHPQQDALAKRMELLQKHLDEFPRNKEDKERLLSCGYSPQLWEKRLSLTVKTAGTLSLEENIRQNLLACYSEFAEILKQMAITHVSVDGEMVKVVDLFTDELSLTSLKGRRAITVRMIDQCQAGSVQGHFFERKAALLVKEEQIEAEFENMAKAVIKPKTFIAAVNVTFFDCARCCGSKIIGCYAPSGEHCERPLEIGMRCDSGIASIYNEEGNEIENAELFFTEEGILVFKVYTNGHPYDTSQVWMELFTALLKEEVPTHSSIVPALIIPKGYPNQRTWELLRRVQDTELTGSLLTCRLDFSPEWRTYYDYRPERVRIGADMILHCGFKLNTDQSRPTFQRQVSRFTKDLAGVVFEEIMQKLLSDDWLKQFRFLGKVFSQYVSACISEGEGTVALLTQGFDYERWMKTCSRATKANPIPPSMAATSGSAVPPKDIITHHLVCFLDEGILDWCSSVDLVQLCSRSYKQLLELKIFLERAQGFFRQPPLLRQLKDVLSQTVKLVPILSLPTPLQEEVIHWIFHNEDRVWRYRGGRSGHETLHQFMNFLGRQITPSLPSGGSGSLEKKAPPYAGVAMFFLPDLLLVDNSTVDPTSLRVRQMVAYAVGEVISADEEEEGMGVVPGHVTRWKPGGLDNCYEIVTAWVHPHFRGLNLSWQMYATIFQQAPAHLVMCDLLLGSVERLIASNQLLRVLDRLRLKRFLIPGRQESYKIVTQVGEQEQFEQVLVRTRPLKMVLGVYRLTVWAREHPKMTSFITMAILAIPTALGVTFKLYKY